MPLLSSVGSVSKARQRVNYILAILLGYILVSLVLSGVLGRPVGFVDAVVTFIESVGG